MSIDHPFNSPTVNNSKSITLKIPTLKNIEKRRSSQDVINHKLSNHNQENENLEVQNDHSNSIQ